MTDYLIQFGRSAFVGRFSSDEDSPYSRGQSVVVKTVRGLEVGAVMCPAGGRFANAFGDLAGELVRSITTDDERSRVAASDKAAVVLNAIERIAGDLPVTFVDSEATLDGTTVVLHVIPFAECDLKPLLTQVATDHQTIVTLFDLSRPTTLPDAPDAVEAGCGKPNCGSESGGGGCGTGGGCSTGSCSKGKVKSAGELTEYFADLRGKMEAEAVGRVALH